MTKIVDMNHYRVMKQRKLFIRLYQFLNKNLDYKLDDILKEFDESFFHICQKHDINPLYVNYFRIPIITFIVTVFINNSNISGMFPVNLIIENKNNKSMFKNTLIQILETFEKNFSHNPCRIFIEKGFEDVIEKGFRKTLKTIPEKIELV